MQILDEQPRHFAEIDALTRAAFGGGEEAGLLPRLRADGLVRAALVAVQEGRVVGHVMYTALEVRVDGREVAALCLAPLSVHPQWQRRGVGLALMRQAHAQLAAQGHEAVIVLGHPQYYPRAGFSAALAAKLAGPFSGEAFMALELVEGALSGSTGTVVYPAAFGIEDGAGH